MDFAGWTNYFLSAISSAVQWMISIQIMGVPVLYALLAILIIGVVLRAVLFKA